MLPEANMLPGAVLALAFASSSGKTALGKIPFLA